MTVYEVVRLLSKTFRGFTMIEVGVVLALLAVISLVAVSAFSATRSGVGAASAVPLLKSAQLELRRTSLPDGSFAVDSLALLTAAGLAATAGAPSEGSISVSRVDASAVVLTAVQGDNCLLLLDRPSAASTWALFRDSADDCTASTLVDAAVAMPSAGTSAAPQEVSS